MFNNYQEKHPIVTDAERFAREVLRPAATEIDREEGVPVSLIRDMAGAGFLGAALPKEYGGAGLDAMSYGMLTEAIGTGCNNARALLTVHTSLVGETICKLGSDSQKEQFLPAMAKGEKIACFALSEPNAGSDAGSIQTTYQEMDDVYVLNGQKKWITYGAVADIFLVFATCNGAISAFLVERDSGGISTAAMSGLMASRGAHLAHVNFENVRVPKENILGKPGMGFTFVANTALFFGRFSIAWAGVAIARAAIEEMVTYARHRHQFDTKIAKHQLVQGLIADAITGLHSARAMCEKISILRSQNDDQAVMETNIAKLHTSRVARMAADNALQVLGGNGLWQEYAVERLYREARVLEIIEGSTQIQQIMVSNFGLRTYFNSDIKRSYPN